MLRQFLLFILILGAFFPPLEATSTEPKLIENLRDNGEARRYLETLKLPDTASGRLIVISKTAERLPYDYLPPLKLGGSYLHLADGTNKRVINSILFSDPEATILFDRKIDFSSREEESGNVRQASFIAKDLMGIEDAWNAYNVSGNGVVLGITDSGVDFGHSDLVDSPKLLDSGITASFDPTGYGAAPTSLTLQPTVVSGVTVLPLEGQNLTLNLGEEGGTALSSDLGITLENLDISNIADRSKSGNFKVGMMYQPGEIRQVFLFVLVDTQQAGVYDELWVDLSTSLGLSLALNGIIFEVGRFYRELVDWSLVNEEPYGPGNPVIAKDIDGDGYNDVSMGALATVLDLNGLVNGGYIRGIDPEGRGIGVIYDAVGHGTQVTSAAAGRGKVPIQIYDNFTTADNIENTTIYYLPGSAPNASVIVTKGLQVTDFLIGWFWLAGLEPVLDGSGGWTVNKDHLADISSNSWGDGSIGQQLKGMDTLSFLLDALSTPDIFSKIDFGVTYPDYPGLIFFVASGNGGPGFGTVATPGAAVNAITIGASTSFHTQQNKGKNDVALFSSNGPTPFGVVKPDLVSLGSFGFTDKVLVLGIGNGTKAAGEFGGTSEATPRAAGVGALMVEALRKNGITPTLTEIRVRLKSTAQDLYFPGNMQGAGLINAYNAVSTVFQDNYLLVRDFSSQQLLGTELSNAFEGIFDVAHPLEAGGIADSFIYGYPEDFKTGRLLTIETSNGSTPTSPSISLVHLEQIDSYTVSFTTTLSSGGVYPISSIPTQLIDSDFLVISIGLTEESYSGLQDAGLLPPTMELIDTESGRIIDESFSTGYSQQLYSGNPREDFNSTPAIVLEDPGFVSNIPFWEGLTYELNFYAYNRVPSEDFSFSQNGTLFNITATPDPIYQIQLLQIAQPFGNVYLPLTVLDINNVGYGENADVIGDELTEPQFYGQNSTFGAFNWYGNTARPEAGDYRFYTLEVPSNATFLATRLSWNDENLVPNLYLYNSQGNLVAQSDTQYVGGGFYKTKTSEPNAQNLFISVNDTRYYLMAHFVQTPFGAGPYPFELLVRYLTLNEIPSPETTFSQDLEQPVSGSLGISATDYSVNEFPELRIDEINVQVYKGRNGTIEGTIPVDTISEAPFTPEFFAPVDFEAGEKGAIGLFWFSKDYDLDLYLFPVDQTGLIDNDILARQGTKPGPVNETAAFSIDRTTTYLVMVDFAGGEVPVQDIEFIVIYDSRQGPSFRSENDNIVINTSSFEDETFGIWINYGTNFDLSFQEITRATFSNYVNFTSSLLSPQSGETLKGNVEVGWTSSVNTTAYIYLEQNELSTFLGSSSSGSFIFDTTLFPDGDYVLRVLITDGIFSHEYQRDIILANGKFSTLDPLATETSTRPIPLVETALILGLLVLSRNRERKRKNRT